MKEMRYKKIQQKYQEITATIEAHRSFSRIIGIILIILVLLISTFFFKKPKPTPLRIQTPHVTLSKGTLSLITLPDEGTTQVTDLIRNARHSIDLVMYDFKDKTIGDALIAAKKRGVAVRVLLNKGYYGRLDVSKPTNLPAYTYLQSRGVAVTWASSSFAFTHQKTLVIDGTKAMIMTFNLSPKYYPTGRDFGVIDTDEKDVQAIEGTFVADWNGHAIASEYGDALIWSPNSENDMMLIIRNAKKSLDIYNEEMADETITNALIDRAAHGVAVRVVMTYTTANKAVFTKLKNAGVHIRTFGGGKHTLYIHAKMILSDNTEVFLGSENFSKNSLYNNRELGIFISDPVILNSLTKTFSGDFEKARIWIGASG